MSAARPSARTDAPHVYEGRPLRILIGTLDQSMPGGIPTAERPFHRALQSRADVELRIMPFGRRRADERGLRRVVARAGDLAYYVRLVRRHRPDLVHLDTAFNVRALVRDLAYVAVSRLLGQPVFLKMHGTQVRLLESPSPALRALIRVVVTGASGIGVLSADECACFVAAGFPPERIHLVANAVDATGFVSAVPRAPARLLFIARMLEDKGISDVLEATALLRRSGRDVVLTCVGDGPALEAARARSRRLGIAGAVTFTGRLAESETAPHYLASTLLVFPSRRESFSMTIFQALAAGLPIVTTRIRAAADHLREPDHCLWVSAGDPNGIAERVGWLLDHPAVRDAMSRANRERARRFHPENVAAAYLDLYRCLVRPPGSG